MLRISLTESESRSLREFLSRNAAEMTEMESWHIGTFLDLLGKEEDRQQSEGEQHYYESYVLLRSTTETA